MRPWQRQTSSQRVATRWLAAKGGAGADRDERDEVATALDPLLLPPPDT
ncbi:MAG TPA: hypothetical protein VKB57_28525 [Acidimicrobiales bacterium]|nr:hypothetical protein [Acidimicrobiales bacterium]